MTLYGLGQVTILDTKFLWASTQKGFFVGAMLKAVIAGSYTSTAENRDARMS